MLFRSGGGGGDGSHRHLALNQMAFKESLRD